MKQRPLFVFALVALAGCEGFDPYPPPEIEIVEAAQAEPAPPAPPPDNGTVVVLYADTGLVARCWRLRGHQTYNAAAGGCIQGYNLSFQVCGPSAAIAFDDKHFAVAAEALGADPKICISLPIPDPTE